MEIDNIVLIFDRSMDDLNNNTDKAFYNETDLNRVESATNSIKTYLKYYSYFHNELQHKINWQMIDFPTESEMQRYLANIQALIDAYYIKQDTPSFPNAMDNLIIEKANAIEKILHDMNELLKNMTDNFNFSGELFLGEI